MSLTLSHECAVISTTAKKLPCPWQLAAAWTTYTNMAVLSDKGKLSMITDLRSFWPLNQFYIEFRIIKSEENVRHGQECARKKNIPEHWIKRDLITTPPPTKMMNITHCLVTLNIYCHWAWTLKFQIFECIVYFLFVVWDMSFQLLLHPPTSANYILPSWTLISGTISPKTNSLFYKLVIIRLEIE